MKRILKYLFVVAACAVAMTACTDDEIVGTNDRDGLYVNHALLELVKGDTYNLVATVTPKGAGKATFTSVDPSTASVDDKGLVTALRGGKTVITTTSGSFKSECTVVVSSPVTTVSLNKAEAQLGKGETLDLVATIGPDDINVPYTVTWTAADPAVVRVTPDAENPARAAVSALAGGNTAVTVKAGEVSATCKVTVDVKLIGITVTPSSARVQGGETVQLTAGKNPVDAVEDVTFSWRSSDENIATVDQTGLVTGKKEGTLVYDLPMQQENGEYRRSIQDIENNREEFRKNSGVAADSEEERELQLLAKEKEASFAGSSVRLSDEEREEIARIKEKGLTQYQQDSLAMKEDERYFAEAIHKGEQEIETENAIITGTKIERLKTHAMTDAQKEAEQIMQKASEDIVNLLVGEAKDHIEEELEEKKERLNHANTMARIESEKRERAEADIFTSDVYLRIQQLLSEGRSMSDEQWQQLAMLVESIYSGFTDKLYSLYKLSANDYHVCLLIKIRMQPKDIALLTAHSKENVATTRSRLYQKIFGKKGSTKEWDDFILSL